jgi:YhcN/YlaJ family sporulation lipoprotein
MRRSNYLLLALVLVFALVFTGCAARRPLQTPVQPRQDTTGMYNNNRGGVGVNTNTGPMTPNGYGNNYRYNNNYGYGNNSRWGTDTGYGNNTGIGNNTGNGINNGYGGNFGLGNNRNLRDTGTPISQADNVARACERVQGVDNATAVVSGNTAYVGIDMKTGNARANNDIAGIKRQCAQQIKAANPNVTTVYVSADADFIDRIRRIGDGVRNGRPVDGFRNELAELVRRLTPERQ